MKEAEATLLSETSCAVVHFLFIHNSIYKIEKDGRAPAFFKPIVENI
jgi:hypothetical protein